MLFQSLLIFIEKCVIIILSERSIVMDFIVRAIYQEVGRRRADGSGHRVGELERGDLSGFNTL